MFQYSCSNIVDHADWLQIYIYIVFLVLDISSITKMKLKEIHTKIGQGAPVKML